MCRVIKTEKSRWMGRGYNSRYEDACKLAAEMVKKANREYLVQVTTTTTIAAYKLDVKEIVYE